GSARNVHPVTPWRPSSPRRVGRQQPRLDRGEDAVELVPRVLEQPGARHGGDEKRRAGGRIEIGAEHTFGDASTRPLLDPRPPMAKQGLDDLADGGIAPSAQLEFGENRREIWMLGTIESRVGEFLVQTIERRAAGRWLAGGVQGDELRGDE